LQYNCHPGCLVFHRLIYGDNTDVRRPTNAARLQLINDLTSREAIMVAWYDETDWSTTAEDAGPTPREIDASVSATLLPIIDLSARGQRP